MGEGTVHKYLWLWEQNIFLWEQDIILRKQEKKHSSIVSHRTFVVDLKNIVIQILILLDNKIHAITFFKICSLNIISSSHNLLFCSHKKNMLFPQHYYLVPTTYHNVPSTYHIVLSIYYY